LRYFPDSDFAATQTAAAHSSDNWRDSAPDFAWNSFLNHTTNASLPEQSAETHGVGGDFVSSEYTGGVAPWTDMFLGDANIDWIGLSDMLTG